MTQQTNSDPNNGRSERRRIRRGRQPSVQQGQGHGERIYLPARPGRRKWEFPRYGVPGGPLR